MTINIPKFGSVLTSRPAGKEAYAAFLPILAGLDENESILVDFCGVSTFSPSWGDEFLTQLHTRFGKRLYIRKTINPSALETIDTLEETNEFKFQFEN